MLKLKETTTSVKTSEKSFQVCVLQADLEGTVTVQRRLQGDSGRTPGTGATAAVRYLGNTSDQYSTLSLWLSD